MMISLWQWAHSVHELCFENAVMLGDFDSFAL